MIYSSQAAANPIRKVVTMLQNMQAKVIRDLKDAVYISILRIGYLVPQMSVCVVFGRLAILRIEGCLNSTPPNSIILGIPQVTEEGKKEQDLYDKFMCYCSKGDGELSKSIADASAI